MASLFNQVSLILSRTLLNEFLACLPKPSEELSPDQECFISEFGYYGVTSHGQFHEDLPDTLQYGKVPVRETPECMVYRSHFRSIYHLCIGGRGIIARDGDSGGPLTCVVKSKRRLNQVLYGVSSFSSAKVRQV